MDARVYTYTRVLYACTVYTFTKLHDRRIPKVRVGVGPMEFQLKESRAEVQGGVNNNCITAS